MSEVTINRDKALRIGCRAHQQFTRLADKEAQDLPHGQHTEALRIALLRLLNLFPKDFKDELEALIEAGSESDKP